jgi:hypothetical protein
VYRRSTKVRHRTKTASATAGLRLTYGLPCTNNFHFIRKKPLIPLYGSRGVLAIWLGLQVDVIGSALALEQRAVKVVQKYGGNEK